MPLPLKRRWSTTMSSSMTPSTGVSPSVCRWIPALPSTLTSRHYCAVLVVHQPLDKMCSCPPRQTLYHHGVDARILHLRLVWMLARPSTSSGSSARCSFTLHTSVLTSHVSLRAVDAQVEDCTLLLIFSLLFEPWHLPWSVSD